MRQRDDRRVLQRRGKLTDLADDLVFEAGFDAGTVGRMTIGQVLYWHRRAMIRFRRRAQTQRRQ